MNIIEAWKFWKIWKKIEEKLKEVSGMSGWKTLAGGIGQILTGIGLIIAGLLTEPKNWEKIEAGAILISTGLSTIGIGHKIEKSKA